MAGEGDPLFIKQGSPVFFVIYQNRSIASQLQAGSKKTAQGSRTDYAYVYFRSQCNELLCYFCLFNKQVIFVGITKVLIDCHFALHGYN